LLITWNMSSSSKYFVSVRWNRHKGFWMCVLLVSSNPHPATHTRARARTHTQVKLSPCLTKHHAMKTCWEWRYSSTHSLISTLDRRGGSVSRTGRFTPRERAPDTHYTHCTGPRADVEAVWKRKTPSSCQELNPDHQDRPARSQSLYRLSYPGSSPCKYY
jgi:hypothetical protein